MLVSLAVGTIVAAPALSSKVRFQPKRLFSIDPINRPLALTPVIAIVMGPHSEVQTQVPKNRRRGAASFGSGARSN